MDSSLFPPVVEELTNIIFLSEARRRYEADKCRHTHVLVDEALAEVECAKCGAKLNPIAVLSRLAKEESRLKRRIEEMKKLSADLDAKTRTKCRNCGQMTPVRIGR